MDKALRPDRLEVDPNNPNAAKEFWHWKKIFEYYLEVFQENLDKLCVLTNFVSSSIYDIFSDCTTYPSTLSTVINVYIKPTNTVFALQRLATHRQQSSEDYHQYLQLLRVLAKECEFQAVTAAQYQEESIRDAFIAGIQSNEVCQHLLEEKTLTLDDM